MTTSTSPTAPVFVAPAPGTRRSSGRRAAIVLGTLAAAFGAVLAIAGGALFAVFGSDGVLSTGRHDVSTSATAIVSGTASIQDTADAAEVLGAPRIKVDAHAAGGRPVFVGVAHADDVERYLAGAAVDEVTDLDIAPFRLDRDRHPGSATPAPPATKGFWVAKDSGARSASVDWKVRDGDYRVVVMNADGRPDVHTDSRIGVEVPFLPGIGAGILGAGLVIVAGGLAAVVVGARRPR